jgi:hypothetical protein
VLRYVPYQRLDARPNLVVDGAPTDGTVLTVTHWPGYPPPGEILDDLSAQMVFKLLDKPQLLPHGVELVSNNHFDQDGLVSLYALTEPAAAISRRRILEDVAAAGDFATSRHRDAARVSMVLSAYAAGAPGTISDLPDDYPQRTAVLYTELLALLPELCDRIDRHRALWADEDATLRASEDAISRGAVHIAEIDDVDLAVVTVDEAAPTTGGHRFGGDWVFGLHPMAVNTATPRLVVATIRGRDYQVELRYESWVQLRSRPLRLRRDLVPLAARLQDAERGDATWQATPVSALTPRLTSTGGDSSTARAQFIDMLVDHLHNAPPAWNPFEPRT